MRIAYLDESSDSAYFVNALLIHEDNLIDFASRFQEFRNQAVDRYKLNPNIEFHGYDLFNANGDWVLLKNEYETIKLIFLGIIDLILSFDIEIYMKGVTQDNFRKRYPEHTRQDIHNAAMIWCLEKIQKQLALTKELVLVVADQEHEGESFYRENLRHFQMNPTFGWQPVVLSNIVDTIHFAPSNASYMLQAIDLLSYANILVRKNVKDSRYLAFQNQLRNKLFNSGRVYYHGTW